MSSAFSAVLPALTPTLSLFPECPEHSPNARAAELAQFCDGPRGELNEPVAADCPPQEQRAQARPLPVHETAPPKSPDLVGISLPAASAPAPDSKPTSVQQPVFLGIAPQSRFKLGDFHPAPF